MVYARLVPWSSPEELAQVKKWFYSTNDDERRRAVLKVRSYESKGTQYLPHVIASTANITDAVLLDNTGNTDPSILQMTYTMALIRFVNGLLDPSQRSQYAIPLHTLARNVGLPPWLVDLRHRGTHERDLCGLNMLRAAASEALDWLWNQYWNDDTLDEDEDDEDGDENDQSCNDGEKYGSLSKEEADILYEVKSLLFLWPEYIMIFKNNKELWLRSRRINIIRSSNFDVPEDASRRGPNKEAVIKRKIEKYLGKWKVCWAKLDSDVGKGAFVKVCMDHYNPLLFHVLLQNVKSSFYLAFLEWLVKEYHTQINGSEGARINSKTLERFFSKWDELEFELVKRQVKYMDVNQVISHWSSLREALDQYPSYLVVVICKYLLEAAESSLKSRYARGKSRRLTPDPIDRIVRDMREYHGGLSKTYTPIEKEIYESSFKSENWGTASRQSANTRPEEAEAVERREGEGEKTTADLSTLSTPDSILSDLASLKRRLNEESGSEFSDDTHGINNKRNKKTSYDVAAPDIKTPKEDDHMPLWEPIANWTPTPFGTLV